MPARNQESGGACPDQTRAIPCTVLAVTGAMTAFCQGRDVGLQFTVIRQRARGDRSRVCVQGCGVEREFIAERTRSA
jgi:hypothetical protein